MNEEKITKYTNAESLEEKIPDAVGFDPLLDITIWKSVFDASNNKGSIEIKVMCYNNGAKKVQIGRSTSDGKYMKPGRFTKDEALKIVSAMHLAISQM
jgi:hypothetical protein